MSINPAEVVASPTDEEARNGTTPADPPESADLALTKEELPPGWTEAKLSTGKSYYYNTTTGGGTWDKPAKVQPLPATPPSNLPPPPPSVAFPPPPPPPQPSVTTFSEEAPQDGDTRSRGCSRKNKWWIGIIVSAFLVILIVVITVVASGGDGEGGESSVGDSGPATGRAPRPSSSSSRSTDGNRGKWMYCRGKRQFPFRQIQRFPLRLQIISHSAQPSQYQASVTTMQLGIMSHAPKQNTFTGPLDFAELKETNCRFFRDICRPGRGWEEKRVGD